MGRLLLCVNIILTNTIIYKFLNQSINVKNTPTKNNHLDLDYHLGGYGLAYFLDGVWHIYKYDDIYINDTNIENIIENIVNLKPKILIGYLQSKINDEILDHSNIQPFIYQKYVFIHDGLIRNFNKYKLIIKNKISEKYIGCIGCIDFIDNVDNVKICNNNECINCDYCNSISSKYFFYLVLSILDSYYNEFIDSNSDSEFDSELNYNFTKKEELFRFVFTFIFEYFKQENIELVGSFIFSDSVNFIAIRYISPNFQKANFPPALYINRSKKITPNIFLNYGLVSSEPINEIWECIRSNHYHMI